MRTATCQLQIARPSCRVCGPAKPHTPVAPFQRYQSLRQRVLLRASIEKQGTMCAESGMPCNVARAGVWRRANTRTTSLQATNVLWMTRSWTIARWTSRWVHACHNMQLQPRNDTYSSQGKRPLSKKSLGELEGDFLEALRVCNRGHCKRPHHHSNNNTVLLL